MSPLLPWVIGLGAVAGLVVGSFVATASLRYVEGRPFVGGRSQCDGCGARLGWAETTPLLAYAARSGRGGCCGHPIDVAHPLGEALGAAVTIAALVQDQPLQAVLIGLLGYTLIALTVIDLKIQRLPDLLVALVGLIAATIALAGQRLLEGGLAAITVLVLLFAQNGDIREAQSQWLRELWTGAMSEISSHDGDMLPGNLAHFGFRDGISQPTITGAPPNPFPDTNRKLRPANSCLGTKVNLPSSAIRFQAPLPWASTGVSLLCGFSLRIARRLKNC